MFSISPCTVIAQHRSCGIGVKPLVDRNARRHGVGGSTIESDRLKDVLTVNPEIQQWASLLETVQSLRRVKVSILSDHMTIQVTPFYLFFVFTDMTSSIPSSTYLRALPLRLPGAILATAVLVLYFDRPRLALHRM